MPDQPPLASFTGPDPRPYRSRRRSGHARSTREDAHACADRGRPGARDRRGARRVRAEPRGGRDLPDPARQGPGPGAARRDPRPHASARLADVKIHSRVVFVIADAGYGKTTLLADFSRRTRLRTIWYRIDEDDRDWVGFLAHLVSAGREYDPEFAPRDGVDPALARARRADPRRCDRDASSRSCRRSPPTGPP